MDLSIFSIYTSKEVPVVLLAIPDGKTKENPTVKIPGKTQVQVRFDLSNFQSLSKVVLSLHGIR